MAAVEIREGIKRGYTIEVREQTEIVFMEEDRGASRQANKRYFRTDSYKVNPCQHLPVAVQESSGMNCQARHMTGVSTDALLSISRPMRSFCGWNFHSASSGAPSNEAREIGN